MPTKNHILAVSAKLFLEQGYRNTTIKEIADKSGVSVSSIQNFFHSKDGLLAELEKIMFAGQFGAAKMTAENKLSPEYIYAAETAIQLALTECNENIREIYMEVYTLPNTVEYIHEKTTGELKAIFGSRFPDFGESEFYEMEIGSAALMRGYMAKSCGIHFPLERKIERFLTAVLRIYRVEEEEIEQILKFVFSLDLNELANRVTNQLFDMLKYKFSEDSEQL